MSVAGIALVTIVVLSIVFLIIVMVYKKIVKRGMK